MLDYVIDGIHGSDGPLSDMVDSNPYGQESVYSYLNKINRLKRQTLDNRPKNKFANSLRVKHVIVHSPPKKSTLI